jgi:ribosomal protein S12 methylthiotransferase accessory factor YcaO
MLVRVLVFRNSIEELIVKDSQIDQCFKKIESARNRIAAQSTVQTSGQNDVRVSSEERLSAREGLREHLENLTRTASSMGLNQFFMPRKKNDRAIVDVAKVFVQLAEPLKAEFVKHHVREDFIDRLKGGIASIERAIQQQVAGKGSRKAAGIAIAAAQAEALTELARLDPMMDNLLGDDVAARAAWHAASKIEAPRAKRGAGKAEEEKPEPQPEPPVIPQAA